MILDSTSGDGHNVLGATATIKLDGADTDGRFAVVEHTVPLHAGPPPHIHDREDELLYVLAGRFQIVLGEPDVWHEALPGTWVHVPAGIIHTARATTDASRLLSIYTPAGGEAFFREIDTIDQTDIPAVLALAAKHGMSFPHPAPATPVLGETASATSPR